MRHNEEIKRLFELYLAGKTNSRQEDILFQYLADSKNMDDEFYDSMNAAWNNEPAKRDHSLRANKGLEQIWSTLEKTSQKKAQRNQILKYAASVVIFLSAALGWYSYQKHQPAEEKAIELFSKITAKGEKIKMILPDSSIVYLAGESKLSWPARFIKGSNRNILLEGEAFFEVKKDPSSPFIIKTGNMQTQVLGTSFNIYAYPKDKIFSVAVRTGKVKVSENINGKASILSLLTPGMKLVYHKDNGKYAVQVKRKDEINSWIENRFVFRNESLERILEKMERYYDVHFELKSDKLSSCQFNATFSNKNIKEVMEQLQVMSGSHIRYKISTNNKLITVWGGGCQ